jgi:hypothetical protein
LVFVSPAFTSSLLIHKKKTDKEKAGETKRKGPPWTAAEAPGYQTVH